MVCLFVPAFTVSQPGHLSGDGRPAGAAETPTAERYLESRYEAQESCRESRRHIYSDKTKLRDAVYRIVIFD